MGLLDLEHQANEIHTSRPHNSAASLSRTFFDALFPVLRRNSLCFGFVITIVGAGGQAWADPSLRLRPPTTVVRPVLAASLGPG